MFECQDDNHEGGFFYLYTISVLMVRLIKFGIRIDSSELILKSFQAQ